MNTSRRNPLGSLASIVLLVPVLALLASPAAVQAASYTGRADTGWGYTNKAYCCEDAVAAAQDDSARACERAGGYPEYRRSSARGRCKWNTRRGSDGRSVYRCSATASVFCK